MKEDVILEVYNLTKHFPVKTGLLTSVFSKEVSVVHAVDAVSFNIKRKEIFGLVGESGCGKTTTGRLLLRLIQPTGGKIIFNGTDIASLNAEAMRRMRRKMQIIFQDPYESLNPRMSIYDLVAEPLRIQGMVEAEEEIEERVARVVESMGLVPPEEYLYRFPHELSGGQRQRVAIARAFILQPEFIVADEPVSMLDASIRSEVSKMILDLVEKLNVSFLYITHDMSRSRYMCNRMAVMYLGKICELGSVEDVTQAPMHPYTEALLAAVPVPDPTARRIEIIIKGEVPNAISPPSGCRFHTRCPYSKDICRKEEPQFIEIKRDRYVACHFPLGK